MTVCAVACGAMHVHSASQDLLYSKEPEHAQPVMAPVP